MQTQVTGCSGVQHSRTGQVCDSPPRSKVNIPPRSQESHRMERKSGGWVLQEACKIFLRLRQRPPLQRSLLSRARRLLQRPRLLPSTLALSQHLHVFLESSPQTPYGYVQPDSHFSGRLSQALLLLSPDGTPSGHRLDRSCRSVSLPRKVPDARFRAPCPPLTRASEFPSTAPVDVQMRPALSAVPQAQGRGSSSQAPADPTDPGGTQRHPDLASDAAMMIELAERPILFPTIRCQIYRLRR